MLGLALSRNGITLIAILAFVATAVAWGERAVQKHDQKVEQRVVAKIEKVTEHAAQNGRRAAARATAPGVRGTRDPSTRDD